MSKTAEVEALWTVEDVAKYLQVSTRTVKTYLQDWQPCGVHYLRLPRGLRFDPEMIKDWARNNIDDPAAHQLAIAAKLKTLSKGKK
jgi:hypothetical protein